MAADLTVIIPTLPGREHLLAEALASVWAQTVRPECVIVRAQEAPGRLGPVHIALQRNAILAAVTTTWVATLDDDDLWRPNHVEVAAARFDGADLVYSWPDPPHAITRLDCTGWRPLELRARLRHSNFIPSAAFMRADKVRQVGGWSTGPYDGERFTDTGATWEDHDLWIRLADAGAWFVCTGEVTWDYRLDGPWEHAFWKGRTNPRPNRIKV